MIRLMITNATQLPELLNLVHDHWFNAETIVLDRKHRTVRMHFAPTCAQLETLSPNGVDLEFRNVDDLIVEDTERVRDYDLNQIQYDGTDGRIVLTGGIPVKIVLQVTALEIDVSSNKPAVRS